MTHMRIELRCDPDSGRREIVVHLEQDLELLPAEHERLHRQLVEQLLGSSLDESDRPQLRIVRAESMPTTSPSQRQERSDVGRHQAIDLGGIDTPDEPA